MCKVYNPTANICPIDVSAELHSVPTNKSKQNSARNYAFWENELEVIC